MCSEHREPKQASLQAGPTGASVTSDIGRMRFTISHLRQLRYLKSSFVAIRKSTAAFNRDYDAQAAAPCPKKCDADARLNCFDYEER